MFSTFHSSCMTIERNIERTFSDSLTKHTERTIFSIEITFWLKKHSVQRMYLGSNILPLLTTVNPSFSQFQQMHISKFQNFTLNEMVKNTTFHTWNQNICPTRVQEDHSQKVRLTYRVHRHHNHQLLCTRAAWPLTIKDDVGGVVNEFLSYNGG